MGTGSWDFHGRILGRERREEVVTLIPRSRGKGAADELAPTRSWREGLAQVISAPGSSSYPTSLYQGRVSPPISWDPTFTGGNHVCAR